MKLTHALCSLFAGLFSAALLHGQVPVKRTVPKPPVSVADPGVKSEPTPPAVTADSSSARVIQYGEKDVIPLKAKLRFTTLIVLPKAEKILDFVTGDKEFWVINGAENMAYVKPAKAGARTNLNLITGSGNIYSFTLSEVGDTQDAPDLKVFIEPKDESMEARISGPKRFVPAQELAQAKQEAQVAREEVQEVKQQEQTQIDRGVNRAVSLMRFSYEFKPVGKRPFRVRTIFHDDRFTYFDANPTELPVVYEVKDGQFNLIDFQFRDGFFVVPKVIDEGFLVIGKSRLHFTRKDQ
jgi:type IV secretory pathway VirB9-like protein